MWGGGSFCTLFDGVLGGDGVWGGEHGMSKLKLDEKDMEIKARVILHWYYSAEISAFTVAPCILGHGHRAKLMAGRRKRQSVKHI